MKKTMFIALAVAFTVLIYRILTVTKEIISKERKINKYDSIATIVIGGIFTVLGFTPTPDIKAAVIKIFAVITVLNIVPDLFFPKVKKEDSK